MKTAPLRLLLLVVTAVACARDVPPPADAGDDVSSPPLGETNSPSTAPRSPGADPWTVSASGAGTARIGATVGELGVTLDPSADPQGCNYVKVAGAPDSVLFMIDSGRLVRVEVTGGQTPTAAGARVGDAESRIRELYPDVREMPHKYTDGRYLIALSAADTMHRVVFETDGEWVTRYRAGVFPQVEWVEGCS